MVASCCCAVTQERYQCSSFRSIENALITVMYTQIVQIAGLIFFSLKINTKERNSFVKLKGWKKNVFKVFVLYTKLLLCTWYFIYGNLISYHCFHFQQKYYNFDFLLPKAHMCVCTIYFIYCIVIFFMSV